MPRRFGRLLVRPGLVLALGALSGCTAGEGFPARAAHLRTHVDFLAAQRLEGRLPGTPGYDSAAAYAARVLRRAGTEPAARDGSGRPGYFQPIAMVWNEIGPGTALELRTGDRTERLSHGQRTFMLLAAGGAAAPVARPPVFVGNGVHAPAWGVDDFAGLDLSGRTVLVTAFPPDAAELGRLPGPVRALYADRKTAQARRLRDIAGTGAAAILFVPDRWLVAEWDELSAEQGRLDYEPATPLERADPRPPIPAAILHADLVDRLFLGRAYHPISHAGRYATFALPDIALRLLVDVRRRPFTTENVIALVPGRDPRLRHEYVVVAAHLDGRGQASDAVRSNTEAAGACAAVLEAAAAVAAHPPRRSVLFVLFTAEQAGRWGSRVFLARPPLPRDALTAVVEVAPIGRASAADGIELVAAPPLLELAREVADEAGSRVRVRRADQPTAFKSASAGNFAEAGIPAIVLAGGKATREGDLPGEQVGELDWQRLQQTTRLLEEVVARAGNARALRVRVAPGRPR